MKKWKRFSAVLSIIVILFGLTACAGDAEIIESLQSAGSGSSQAASAGKETYTIYMVDSFVGYFYCNNVYEGALEAAKKLGDVELKRVGPYSIDMDQQIQAFQDAVADGADGIFVTTFRQDLWTEPIDEAIAAGIPVVCYDCDDPDSDRLAYYGTINYKAGYQAGLAMADELPDDGTVAILTGSADAQNSVDRVAGFLDALRNETHIEVLAIKSTDNLLAVGQRMAIELLDEYPDIDGLYASSGSDAQAAAGVLSSRGYEPGKVKILAFDDEEETLSYIKSGYVFGTVVQNTHAMGYESVMYLHRVLTGELPMVKAENGSDINDTGVVFVTKDNLETYQEEWKFQEE